MPTKTELRDQLNEAGHLHVFLDSGAEFAVSKHDTTVTDGGTVVIDSKAGDWKFPVEKVEYTDTEPSGLEEAA